MRIVTAAVSLAALAAALAAAPALAQGEGQPWTVSGALEDGDAQGAEQHRYDDHRVRLEAGHRYRLSVNSEAFDPVARLLRAGQSEVIAENDDSGDGLNSRISYAPTESGDYILRVTGFAADARGAYTAEVAQLPPLPPPVSTAGIVTTTTGSWALWQGELAASDPERDGHHFDDYLIRLEPGQRRYISLEGEGFDTIVQLLRPADRDSDSPEFVDQDDDAGAGYNSLLAFAPEEPGEYIVRVTSFEGDASGAYRLWISQ